MRQVLPSEKIAPSALKAIDTFHCDVVTQVQAVVRDHAVVVVGMAQNPYVKKARTLLKEKGKEFKYLEFGNYFSAWKPRLAIKIWSGWPTFPQVFIDGRLIGGYKELKEHLKA